MNSTPTLKTLGVSENVPEMDENSCIEFSEVKKWDSLKPDTVANDTCRQAAPTVAKLAALFGATVIRVSFDGIPDMGPVLVDGNLGKRDVNLDLKFDEGKATLRELVKEWDVFLDGYRPQVMERLGFGPEDVRKMVEEEKGRRGLIYVRENCYGWLDPLSKRSGWQQISYIYNCNTGASFSD